MLLVLNPLGAWPAVAAPPGGHPTASDLRHTDLLEALDNARRQGGVPALGLVLMGAGEPVLVTTLGTDATPDTPFRWGSITKSFTALTALRLVQQGKLTMDQRIAPLLRSHVDVARLNPWHAMAPVRLVHLLALSAGMADLSADEFNFNQPLSLGDALARHPESRRLHWPAGLQHSYTNVTPGLTAAVIERAAGQTFEEAMTKQLLVPLGMTRTSLDPLPELPGGYQANGTRLIPYWHVTYRAFGALNASVADFARFLTALLNDGRVAGRQVLEPGTVAHLFQPLGTLGAAAGLQVGYGAGAYGRVRRGQIWFGHGGDADGYLSRYALLPADGLGYALVINTDDPPLLRRMERLVESHLTANLPAPRLPDPVVLQPAELDRYTGHYAPSSARFRVGAWQRGELPGAQVRVTGNGLEFATETTLGANRRVTPLLPLGAGRFRRAQDPAATVVFVEGPFGALYLQGELGNWVHLKPGRCPGFIATCDPQ